ncbi:replication initiator protein A [Enterococcus gilvus]|uniref:Replication initiator A N-terminal domain-containing protein n=1 Tax=Enterococcus gilvus ATCC BAA-350 TaxID=1158614 RepID=R2XEC2_9ENTE|nr:replication initiator protein A [Enterococcus gilvus]EOI53199.1 hypothetical protein UKC_03992 [Enterococcus gilvus ATCC BAA-350]EOW78448.1 hypothetical protein I592_04041 [Enterococcus gilvus ATCC BAA-350]OJG38828.1 hypothetical protein RV02_GL002877 [Enterococcus gilvus]
MSEFNYFKADRVYNELYYQFPKVFLVSEDYRKMSDSTKIAYMLLKARLQAAIAKRQVDEEGNIYFTYTTKELCSVLNCQKQKAIDIKKNLEKYGLLLQKDMGFNKKLGKQNPNRMYLAELNITENDIYMLEQFDADNSENKVESQGMKIIPTPGSKVTAESVGVQEGMKIIPRQNVDKSEGMKISQVFNNNYLDTNRHNIDTEKDRLQDQLLLDNFVELMQDASIGTFIPKTVLTLIKSYSNSFAEANDTVKTIHNAKNKAKQNTGIHIVYEEIGELNGSTADALLYVTLLKAYQKQRTEKVENLQNLIFVYVRNFFEEQVTPKFKDQRTF